MNEKPKIQFSKIHVVYSNIFIAFTYVSSYILNFVLSMFEKQQIDFALPLAIITTYGAIVTAGYYVQNMVRDTSSNKLDAIRYKIDNDEEQG